jgi:FemAB-related protein (PEP-CTERM system-associated)
MTDQGVEIRATRPEIEAQRDRYVEGHPQGTFFHLAGWSRAVERVYGHRRFDLAAWDKGEMVGLLPLVQCKKPFGGCHLISMPYAVYGGPIARDPAVEKQLVERAVELGREQRVGRVELRCLEEKDFGLSRSELYATFIQDLPEDPAEVMKSMPKRARAEVRKARNRFGLRLSEGPWYMDDLARLFHRSKRSLGSPGLPAEWFASLMDELGDRVVIHLARIGSQAVGAMMSFLWRDQVLIYYIGTAENANHEYKVTNYLCTSVKEWAVERSYRKFDFGRSRKDSGAFRFKVHQGAEPRDLHYQYHLERAANLPSFNPSNPRTRVLQRTWSRMPLWLATRLSKPLARYLP